MSCCDVGTSSKLRHGRAGEDKNERKAQSVPDIAEKLTMVMVADKEKRRASKASKAWLQGGGGWLGGVFFRSWGVALMHKELEDLRHPKLGEIIL